jgi:hypothetical protein
MASTPDGSQPDDQGQAAPDQQPAEPIREPDVQFGLDLESVREAKTREVFRGLKPSKRE